MTMWTRIAVAAAALTGAAAMLGVGALDSPEKDAGNAQSETYALDFTMPRLEGSEQRLDAFKGKVVLIVNTASKCGLTPQYAGLEAMYEKYKDQGLVILGFPANNFNGQEPGTDKEISAFCTKNFGITFPMFSKISVKGKDMHPLYQRLTHMPAPIAGEVMWNFQKYLVDRSGNVVAKFHPTVKPEDPALVSQVEALLADKG